VVVGRDANNSKNLKLSLAAQRYQLPPHRASQANLPKQPASHQIRTIPVNLVLENKEVRITIHNLIKFNPDYTYQSLDLFPVDYALDYYIPEMHSYPS